MRIFLDNERVPVRDGWTIVRDFGEFTRLYLRAGSAVTEISFDHDLGRRSQGDGIACVRWLIELAMDEPDMVSGLQRITFHSASDTGIRNMRGWFESAQRKGVLSSEIELVNYSCLFHSDHAMMPKDFNEAQRVE